MWVASICPISISSNCIRSCQPGPDCRKYQIGEDQSGRVGTVPDDRGQANPQGDPLEFEVIVRFGGSETRHHVTDATSISQRFPTNRNLCVAPYPAIPGAGSTLGVRASRNACSSAARAKGFCSTMKPCATASRTLSL